MIRKLRCNFAGFGGYTEKRIFKDKPTGPAYADRFNLTFNENNAIIVLNCLKEKILPLTAYSEDQQGFYSRA